uniref:Restriction endonuclease type IV Mrr domain-containing protein n=1 Tax=viral metagenome TaxID=1070528 RepID=A0A6C0IYM0_9ZZZZ
MEKLFLELDLEINPWLKDIDISSNLKNLNKLLNLGKQISSLADISINPASSLLDPIHSEVVNLKQDMSTRNREIIQLSEHNNTNTQIINHKLETINTCVENSLSRYTDESKQQYKQLTNIVNKLTGDANTSSIKGCIGENFLEKVLKIGFQDDSIEVTASKGHESDIHLISSHFPKMLIESKLYSSPVNSTEIKKFYNDLDSTGINYGLFVSLSSSIIGHRRLEYKCIKGKHVVFIPNCGFENMNIIYGILFLREISQQNNKNISGDLLDEKCQLIYNSLKYLDILYENISKLKNDALKMKTTIDTQVNTLISNSIHTEVVVKSIILKMKENITDCLSDLDCSYTILEKDVVDDLIKGFIESNNKLENSIGNSLVIFTQKGYVIHEDRVKSKYSIRKNGDSISELKILKSKAQYTFKGGLTFDVKPNLDINYFNNLLEIL